MISLKNITKKYDDKLVLDNLSLSFEEDEINIISGPSGCGKTTLFNILSGIDKDFIGEIAEVPENISYLFQEDRLLPYYSVIENVLFTMPESIDFCERVNIAKRTLSDLDMYYDHDTFPHKLSGGMARRTAIARALAYPCDLLLMDEPFNALNIELKRKVVDTITSHMKANGTKVIIITHDLTPFNAEDKLNIISLK